MGAYPDPDRGDGEPVHGGWGPGPALTTDRAGGGTGCHSPVCTG